MRKTNYCCFLAARAFGMPERIMHFLFLFYYILFEEYEDDLMKNHWGSFYLLPDLLLS